MNPSIGAQCIDRTIAVLEHFKVPGLEFERRSTSLIIKPSGQNTFLISIYDEGHEAMITAERWHTHYEDPDQIAFCALWLLTPFYRIVHELKGGNLVATWLESYESEGWVAFEAVHFLNPEHAKDWELAANESCVWRHYQQNVAEPPESILDIHPEIILDEQGLPPGTKIGVSITEGTKLRGREIEPG